MDITELKKLQRLEWFSKSRCHKTDQVNVYVHIFLMEHHLKIACSKLIRKSKSPPQSKGFVTHWLIDDVAEGKSKYEN